MLKQPKRTKFRKQQKGSCGSRVIISKLRKGKQGLRAVEAGRLTAQQLESGRRVLRRHLPRQAQIYVNFFPDIPVRSTPIGRRMGKGKGNISYWATYIQPGKVLYEIANVDNNLATRALKHAAEKMPIITKIIYRRLPLNLLFH